MRSDFFVEGRQGKSPGGVVLKKLADEEGH